MTYKNFEEYIKKRSVDEIMEDYGEQQDEWQTLVVRKDGYVSQFCHNNGNNYFCIQYKPEFGEVLLREEQKNLLVNKTVENQMSYFYVQTGEEKIALSDFVRVVRLILEDEMLVGAVVEKSGVESVLMMENSICENEANKKGEISLLFVGE